MQSYQEAKEKEIIHNPPKAVLSEWLEQKLDFVESEREYIVRKSIDQPCVIFGNEIKRSNRTKVQSEYS